MKSIYNLIKEEVRRHPIIKNSILADSINWKRSHYIILAELISEELSEKEELRNEKRFELGTSISHITLQRFFESDYDFKTHNDFSAISFRGNSESCFSISILISLMILSELLSKIT